MKTVSWRVATLACAAALSLTVSGCGRPAADQQDASTAATGAGASQRDDAKPLADDGIDVKATGSQVATYHGPKYIVSDVTVDQATGDSLTEGLGLQEICVVNQPDSWGQIASIGWDRNSISYTQVATAWGTVSYRYEYVNEASGVDTTKASSRTTEAAYFEGFGNVEHVQVGDRKVAYVVEEEAGEDLSMGFVDLEAEAAAAAEGGGEAVDVTPEEAAPTAGVMVYAYEQRADKCALLVTVTCQVNQGASFNQTGEEIVREAFAPLEFKAAGDEVDAASFLSDVTISNADSSRQVVIARNGESLLSYTEHMALLLGDSPSADSIATVTYDFAPQEHADESAEAYGVDGFEVFARVDETSNVLTAWLEVNGSPLRIETSCAPGEDVDSVLARLVEGRISPQE